MNSDTPLQIITNVITKFSFATKGGIAVNNPYKQNQDAYLTNPHILGLSHSHFFSVCDGHGTNGHHVSNFLKFTLPKNIEESLSTYPNIKAAELTEYPDFRTVKQSLRSAFKKTNDSLCNTQGLDVRFSGSTCVSVLTFGRKIYVANVGDSRSILVRQGK
jgi:serine/threonine protein phosphatase PrpC